MVKFCQVSENGMSSGFKWSTESFTGFSGSLLKLLIL